MLHQSKAGLIISVLMFTLLVNASGQTIQPNSTLLDEQATFASEVVRIKGQLLEKLTPSEANIANHIVVRVLRNGDIQYCQAGTPTNGEYPIFVSQEFLRSLYMFTMADIISRKRGNLQLENDYIEYVLSGFHQSLADPKHPPHIDSPSVWMHLTPSEEPSVLQKTGQAWSNGMAFVLSHEFAHHILGDTSDPKEPTKELKMQREEKADAWATHHLISLGISPTSSDYPLAYFSALFIDLGDRAEHPSGACRGRAQYVATLNNLYLLKENSGLKDFDIGAARKRLKDTIAKMDSSPDGCPEGHPVEDVVADAADHLGDVIEPLLRGHGQKDMCSSKGKFISSDGNERNYETDFKPSGWDASISTNRGDVGCLLLIKKQFASDAVSEGVYQLVKKYLMEHVDDCEEKDSSVYDERIHCDSIGATLGVRKRSRSVSFIVDGN